jgi:hypothetical protein
MAVFTLAQHAWQSMHWVDRIGDLAIRLESHGAVIASATTLAAGRGLPRTIEKKPQRSRSTRSFKTLVGDGL